MSTTINGKIQKWIPLLQIGILSLGTLLSFITSYSRGEVSLYMPFISETGAYTPAKCIFSLFLIIGSFIGCIIIFFVYVTISAVSNGQIKYHFNLFSCVVGILSMIGLAGVAAFPMTTVFWAHLVCASVYFMMSALYFICITFITWKIYGKNYILKIRFGLSCIIIVLLVLIAIFFPLSLKKWHEKNSIIPALKEPEHDGFTLLFISSLLEWSIVLVIILFNATFIKDMNTKTIVVMIHPEESKEDLPAEGYIFEHCDKVTNLLKEGM